MRSFTYVLMALATISSGAATAQEFDPAETAAQTADLFAAQYAYEGIARDTARGLHERLQAGAFDNITDGDALADMLTENLRALSGDNHVRVVFDADRVQHYRDREAARVSGEAAERIAEAHAEDVAASVANNFGIASVALRPGGIGVIRIDYFDGNLVEGGVDRIASAMAMVEGADALIFDLRHNVGGDLESVGQWLSYLFGSDPVHYATEIERYRGSSVSLHTDAALPGQRPDVPVYILTSGTTFSGAEHFAYHLRHLGRSAAIIGERTYGGGVGWDPIVINDNFYIRLPRTLVVNAVTGTLFAEGEGVAPDVTVPATRALQAAEAMALTALMEAEPAADQRVQQEWALRIAEGRLSQDEAHGLGITEFEGTFGPFRFVASDDALMLSFNERPPYRLERIGASRFYDDRSLQRQFAFETENGAVVAVMMELYSEEPVSIPRNEE